MHTSKALRWLLASFTAALVGCAASGPQFRELGALPEKEGQIILYRTEAFLDGGVAWRVDLDGRKAAVLRNGGYAVVQVPAGTHSLELRADSFMNALSFKNIALPVEVAPNSRLFVRAGVEPTAIILPAYVGRSRTFAVVSAETAMPELRALKLSE